VYGCLARMSDGVIDANRIAGARYVQRAATWLICRCRTTEQLMVQECRVQGTGHHRRRRLRLGSQRASCAHHNVVAYVTRTNGVLNFSHA